MTKHCLMLLLFLNVLSPAIGIAGDSCSFTPSNVTAVVTGGGVPVGTVIIWPFSTNPEGWSEGKWLECNGQAVSASAYPELRALGYASVPDFRERTPWGSSSPGQYREAGLPNITGQVGYNNIHELFLPSCASGAFYVPYTTQWGIYGLRSYTGCGPAAIDASRCSPVYGRSTTVQPAAYTVRYLIRAAS